MISVIIPVHDEEANVTVLHRRLLESLETLAVVFEIIYVDDNSRDKSFEILSGFAVRDSRVVALQMARHYGQTMALQAGSDGFTWPRDKKFLDMGMKYGTLNLRLAESLPQWNENFRRLVESEEDFQLIKTLKFKNGLEWYIHKRIREDD